jgi:hypothetical protein
LKNRNIQRDRMINKALGAPIHLQSFRIPHNPWCLLLHLGLLV